MNHTHHLTAVNEPTPIKCAPDVIGIIEEVTWPLSLAPIMKLCSSRLESKTARGKVTDKPWHILNRPTSSRGAGKPNAHTDLGIYEKKIVQRPQYRKSFEEAERNWNRNKDRNKNIRNRHSAIRTDYCGCAQCKAPPHKFYVRCSRKRLNQSRRAIKSAFVPKWQVARRLRLVTLQRKCFLNTRKCKRTYGKSTLGKENNQTPPRMSALGYGLSRVPTSKRSVHF